MRKIIRKKAGRLTRVFGLRSLFQAQMAFDTPALGRSLTGEVEVEAVSRYVAPNTCAYVPPPGYQLILFTFC